MPFKWRVDRRASTNNREDSAMTINRDFYAESPVHYDGSDRMLWGECTDCGTPFWHEGEWDNVYRNINGEPFCTPCRLLGDWNHDTLMARFAISNTERETS